MFLNEGGEDPVRFIKPIEKKIEANKAFYLKNPRSLRNKEREEEDLESLFKSLLNEAPSQPVTITEEVVHNPRVSRWMKLKPGQGLGKWNQAITEPITIQTRLHRQGLGYQENKMKIGQDTPAKKWSISKKVTRPTST